VKQFTAAVFLFERFWSEIIEQFIVEPGAGAKTRLMWNGAISLELL
jgi:hypothetical protein